MAPNTQASLTRDLTHIGLRPGMTVMVHTALGKVGWTVGGPVTLIRALLSVLGDSGTLVMPAETPDVSDPSTWDDARVRPAWHDTIRTHLPVFDPDTTPTTLGAVPEAFRTFPGTRRSRHPLVSVCANGALAETITREHALPFGEGRGTPFEKLYDHDARILLLGVGFDRCTTLHYAESLTAKRRTTTNRYPMIVAGKREWVENPDMANDDGAHFPAVGAAFLAQRDVNIARVGQATSTLVANRELVDFAKDYFTATLE